MLATPLRVVDVLAGHLLFVALRLVITTTVFLVDHGGRSARSPRRGRCCASRSASSPGSPTRRPIFAFSATRENDSGFAMLFRFGIVPMFLFSGTFFPVSQLPDWLAAGGLGGAAVARRRPVPRPRPRDSPATARRWCTSATCACGRSSASSSRGRLSSGGWSRDRVDPRPAGSRRPALRPTAGRHRRRAVPDRAQRAGLPHGLAGAALRHLRADLLPVLGRRRSRPSWSATSSCPAASWSATPCSSRRRCSRPRR